VANWSAGGLGPQVAAGRKPSAPEGKGWLGCGSQHLVTKVVLERRSRLTCTALGPRHAAWLVYAQPRGSSLPSNAIGKSARNGSGGPAMLASIHTDQIGVHRQDAVSFMPKIVVMVYRPKYNRNMPSLHSQADASWQAVAQRMRRFGGACRFVSKWFNSVLALQKANYEAGSGFIGRVAVAGKLARWCTAGQSRTLVCGGSQARIIPGAAAGAPAQPQNIWAGRVPT